MKDNMRFVTKGLSGLSLLRLETHAGTCKGYSGMWLIVMLLVVLMAGCNGNNASLGGGTGPTVLSTVPAAGATNVDVGATITATFSVPMDSATIISPATTFTVSPATGTVTLSSDGLTATFTPDSLTEDTLYTATITTGAKSADGIALATDKVWTFSTGPAPTVVSTVPVNLATGVAVNTTITATFSQAMTSSTIVSPAKTFTLTGPGSANVDGTVTYDAATKIATFTPSANLAAGSTVYTATISGVRDAVGNPMVGSTSWTFTTVP